MITNLAFDTEFEYLVLDILHDGETYLFRSAYDPITGEVDDLQVTTDMNIMNLSPTLIDDYAILDLLVEEVEAYIKDKI